MKIILQINSVINSGSTGRIAEEIGQLAMSYGWKSYIAYGRNNNGSNSHKIKIGNSWDIKLHGIQTRLFDRHGLASRQATKCFVEQIKEIKPDIIHLHNIHGYYLNIEVLFDYLALIDTPVVWTLHDCWPITGHCTHFSFCGCEKWKDQCYNCPQKEEYPSSMLFDRSRQNFIQKKKLFTSVENLTIVTVSKWLNEVVSESFLHGSPIKTIYNGINTDIFYPITDISALKSKYPGINKTVLLGVANVWSDRKGFRDFIKLSERLPHDISVILLGLSEQQIKRLPSNVIGLKRTESIQKLVELYNIADVVLNLSAEETFGMTTVEGFSCGIPGIVYNTTASPELITSETGFVVEQGDIYGILRSVDEIKRRGHQFYRDACRKRALSFYKKEDRYAEYLNLYEELLK